MVFFAHSVMSNLVFFSNTITSVYVKLSDLFVQTVAKGPECRATTFCLVGKVLLMHRLISDVLSSMSTAWFLTITNQAGTLWSEMRMNNCRTHSIFTTLGFAVHGCGDVIDVNDSFPVGGGKSLLIKIGPPPLLSNLASANKTLDVLPIKILTQ